MRQRIVSRTGSGRGETRGQVLARPRPGRLPAPRRDGIRSCVATSSAVSGCPAVGPCRKTQPSDDHHSSNSASLHHSSPGFKRRSTRAVGRRETMVPPRGPSFHRVVVRCRCLASRADEPRSGLGAASRCPGLAASDGLAAGAALGREAPRLRWGRLATAGSGCAGFRPSDRLGLTGDSPSTSADWVWPRHLSLGGFGLVAR